jgi:hypothetical protein
MSDPKGFYGQAIGALAPGCAWGLTPADELIVQGGVITNLTWHDTNPMPAPTADSIVAKAAELAAAYDGNQYQRLRDMEYPSIGDQLDAIFKGGDAFTSMQAQVMAVKAKYPKPTGG